MRSLLCCCLLGFFIATGTCLECESCFGIGNSCTGVNKTCAAGEDTCIISLKQMFQSPMTATYITKNCGHSSECNIGIREMDFGNRVGVRMDRVCCTGEACDIASTPERKEEWRQEGGQR
ncbi:phospholipase A2 inhibitor NAI-like [Tiliqua scincoides]|uniref:phospholipase A2 inhibitor NAI-like n=1 Tax=Tiliqua scincoides TaxID=71010 RepID=UPI0034620E5A